MKRYDVIVVGSGSGMMVAEEALEHGLKVALVDKGPLGGTCLNLGCIPSKILIYAADRVVDIQEAGRLGVDAGISSVDFSAVMGRMRAFVGREASGIRGGVTESRELAFYEGAGHFTDGYTMEVNGEKIKGDKILLASGSRVLVPPIRGLDTVKYLTSETLLQLGERPDSLVIIGGGYVGVEYGHFFAAMGTKVIIVEAADRIVLPEEPEISALLAERMGQRMEIHTGVQVEEVKEDRDGRVTVVTKVNATGAARQFTAGRVLLAAGRRSNADTLKVENAGVATDRRGYVKVNDYLETSQKNIWAVGDATGQQMFTHAANRAAALVADAMMHGTRAKMEWDLVPHAVFSHPQIASVGLTEADARKDHDILVGKTFYRATAKGEAMVEAGTFAKAIASRKDAKLLGFHIIGPYAPELIQEVVNAMASGGHIDEIIRGINIHPAMS